MIRPLATAMCRLVRLLCWMLLAPSLFASPKSASENKQPVILGTSDWAPYYSAELPGGGYVAEISHAAFARAGYPLKIRFVPWKRAVEIAKSGLWHGVLGAYYSEERNQLFQFSEAIVRDETVFIGLKQRQIRYQNLRELSPYRIGIILGGAYSREFDQAHYLNKQGVTHHNQNLKKLFAGRIDLLLSSRQVIHHAVQQHYPEWADQVDYITPPLTVQNLHIMISRQIARHDHLISAFNQGLAEIRRDGTFAEILARHGAAGSHLSPGTPPEDRAFPIPGSPQPAR